MKNLFLFIIVGFLFSCAKGELQDENRHLRQEQTVVSKPSGMLQFHSLNDFAAIIAEMKNREIFDIKLMPSSRAVFQESLNDFISLRQHLFDQGLREFTDAELSEIAVDSLEYEPEDSLIVDPYMTAILNTNREVQIENKICRFVEDGMLMYDANDKVRFDPTCIEPERSTVESLAHGQSIEISDKQGIKAQFVKVDYIQQESIVQDRIIDTGNSNSNDNTVTLDYDGSITLTNGVKIPKEQICRATYTKGGGNGSWLAKNISGLFGLNVTITNNYDKRHRMKLRMYEQDYIIYRAVGMTVRMQKRTLGIWWRKKAQEFRYGWSALECEYKFPSPAFPDPPKMQNGVPEYNKYPTAMIKKFPFANPEIVLFHIPVVNYDVATSDVNDAMAAGLKKMVTVIQKWFNDSHNQNLKNNPRGLFTTFDEDRKIRVIFPQGEEIDYHTGREVVKWDKQWFSGNFQIGFSSNLSGNGFHYERLSFSPAKDVSIIRGRIYGAVKYNNQWKACIIETK